MQKNVQIENLTNTDWFVIEVVRKPMERFYVFIAGHFIKSHSAKNVPGGVFECYDFPTYDTKIPVTHKDIVRILNADNGTRWSSGSVIEFMEKGIWAVRQRSQNGLEKALKYAKQI